MKREKQMNKKILLILPLFSLLICSCTKYDEENNKYFNPVDYANEIHFDESQSYLREGIKSYNFYNFNDFHGATEYIPENGEPGINYLSSYLKQEKNKAIENNEGFILTSSGDMWQGSADSNITRGRLVIDWLNSLSCQAQAIGNHEFDWGKETIQNNIELMDFPLLACNIIDIETKELVDYVKPFTTSTINGLNIGFIGSIGSSLKSSILLDNVRDVNFIDPTENIIKSSNYLKQNGADVIVLLNHDSFAGIEVYDYIDIAFNGHSHTYENSTFNNVPSMQAYSNGKAVSYVKLNFDYTTNDISFPSKNVISLSSIPSKYEEDEETVELYQSYLNNEINEVKNQVCGTISSSLSRSDIITYLLDLINLYYVDNWKSEFDNVCFITHNNARSDLSAGEITYGMIYKALPFDNNICLLKMSNSEAKFFKNDCEYSLIVDADKSNDKYIYILTIDYLAQKFENNYNIETVKTFDKFPRDIFFEYFSRLNLS